MPLNSARANLLAGYRDRIRSLRNGTASYNDDSIEQANRMMYGYEDTLRGHEQWEREQRKRFAEDVDNIGKLQGLQSNALALNAQRRTQESGIARTNFMNEADVRARRMDLEKAERLFESDISFTLSKREREMADDRVAMLVAQESLDAIERQRKNDSVLMKSASFEALEQAIRRGRVGKSTIEKLNAIREEQDEDYDPPVDDITKITLDDDGLLRIDYASGETHPWQNYEALLSFGRLNPQYSELLSLNLPAQLAEQARIDRAAAVERENQERQFANQERSMERQYLNSELNAMKSELDAWKSLRDSAANAGQDTKDYDGRIKTIANAMEGIRTKINGGTPAPTGEGALAPGGALGAGAAYTRQAKESAVFKP